jgi:hypothetical protein
VVNCGALSDYYSSALAPWIGDSCRACVHPVADLLASPSGARVQPRAEPRGGRYLPYTFSSTL